MDEIFGGGIRFFLRRAFGQNKLENRQREALGLVIESIRKASAGDPIHLASRILTALREYTSAQKTPNLVPESESRVNAITELPDTITALDREALRRYYVEQETEEEICRALNITTARFRAIKSTIKAGLRPRPK